MVKSAKYLWDLQIVLKGVFYRETKSILFFNNHHHGIPNVSKLSLTFFLLWDIF